MRGLAPIAKSALCFDKPLCATLDGFSLHAATHAGALDVEGREALLRYVLRPPLAQDRLELALVHWQVNVAAAGAFTQLILRSVLSEHRCQLNVADVAESPLNESDPPSKEHVTVAAEPPLGPEQPAPHAISALTIASRATGKLIRETLAPLVCVHADIGPS